MYQDLIVRKFFIDREYDIQDTLKIDEIKYPMIIIYFILCFAPNFLFPPPKRYRS